MQTTTETTDDLAHLGGVAINDREFQLFKSLIYQQTGISLGDSKTTMLSARLSKRIRQLGLSSFEAYHQLLQTHGPESEEYRRLINCITVNKTSFFREIHHFDFLSAQLKQRSGSQPLRIWSAACSTGQEPYSIAMTVAETMGSLPGRDIRILASDIDTEVLAEASEGCYDGESLLDLPPGYQARYFQPEQAAPETRYRVKSSLRDLITFRHKNLISPLWGISIKFDCIFCRNVLIYFDHGTQDQILRRFLTYLKPRGYLIVGHSENLHWLCSLLEPIGHTIYQLR